MKNLIDNDDRAVRIEMYRSCIGREFHYRPRPTPRYCREVDTPKNPHRTKRVDHTKAVRAIRRSDRQQCRAAITAEFLTSITDTNYWGCEVHPNQWAYETALEDRAAECEQQKAQDQQEMEDCSAYYPDQWEMYADDYMLKFYEKREMWDEHEAHIDWCQDQAARPEAMEQGRRMRQANVIHHDFTPATEPLLANTAA